MRKKLLCGVLVLAMALTCGCQGQTSGGASEATPSPAPAADDADSADSGDSAGDASPEPTADAPADWVWVVEPSFHYDDVEPIWAMNFSDSGGLDSNCDGWLPLLSNEYTESFYEISFQTYSCLPQYYRVRNGSSGRLFYMPDQIDSGTLTAAWDGNLYIFDGNILFYGENGEMPPWPQPDAPWNVLGGLERGTGSARLVYDKNSGARLEGGFTGELMQAAVTDVDLHKPYPIQRAETEGSGGYAFAAPDGRLLTDFVYDQVGTFSDGIAAVCQDGRWGYIDADGKPVTELVYDAPWDTLSTTLDVAADGSLNVQPLVIAYPCTCDTMVVRQKGGMGLLYRDGSVLIDFGEFEDMAPAWNNQLWVEQDGQWGLLDLAAVKAAAGLPEWDVSQPYDEVAIANARTAKYQALLDHWFKDMAVRPDALLDPFEFMEVTAEPSLTLRAGPGTDYDRLDSIPTGVGVSVVARNGDGWAVVCYNNHYGWVSEEYLDSWM